MFEKKIKKIKIITDGIEGTYFGEVIDGVPNGKGECTWMLDTYNKVSYNGDWLNGTMHGKGVYATHAPSAYSGNTWTYEGEFVNGKFEGCGVKRAKNGWKYEGEWKDGKQHGNGTCTYASGNVEKGMWVDDKRNGPGSYYDAKEDSLFEGNFKDDKRCGYGELKWADGRYYKGEWSGMLFQGKGVYKNEHGIWEGEFDRGHIHGDGKWTSNDGLVFEGHWNHGNYLGCKGKIVFPNGDIYEGEVGSDYGGIERMTMHGKGVYTYANGKVYRKGFTWGRRNDERDAEYAAERAAKEAKMSKEAKQYRAKKKKEREERRKKLTEEDFALRRRLEEACKAIYGDETDIKKRYEILKSAYFASHNSGYNDAMAWELSMGETPRTRAWQEAIELEWEIKKLCEYYELEVEED